MRLQGFFYYLLLTGMLTALGFLSLKNILIINSNLLRQQKIVLQKNLATNIALKITEDLDSHALDDFYKLHTKGEIRSSNEVLNTLSTRSDSLHFNEQSTAISIVSFRGKFFSVHNLELHADSITLDLCAKNDSALTNIQLGSSFFLLGFTRQIEIEITARDRISSECQRVHGNRLNSLFFDNYAPAENLLLGLEVADNYTIYQDTAGRLRKITHQGNLNTSNQILGTLNGNFNLATKFLRSIFQLEFIYSGIKSKEEKISQLSRVPRISRSNFIILALSKQ